MEYFSPVSSSNLAQIVAGRAGISGQHFQLGAVGM